MPTRAGPVESDVRRQAMLERVGNCVFVRIRGSAYIRDPVAALAPLRARTDELRIRPASPYAARGRSVTRLLRCPANRLIPEARSGEELKHQPTPETRPVPSIGSDPASLAADAARFHRAMMRIYDRARDEAGYNATVLRRMLTDHGGVGAARYLLGAGHVSDGFTALWERGRVDLTVEALVLDPRYRTLFTDEELAVARGRVERARQNLR